MARTTERDSVGLSAASIATGIDAAVCTTTTAISDDASSDRVCPGAWVLFDLGNICSVARISLVLPGRCVACLLLTCFLTSCRSTD